MLKICRVVLSALAWAIEWPLIGMMTLIYVVRILSEGGRSAYPSSKSYSAVRPNTQTSAARS